MIGKPPWERRRPFHFLRGGIEWPSKQNVLCAVSRCHLAKKCSTTTVTADHVQSPRPMKILRANFYFSSQDGRSLAGALRELADFLEAEPTEGRRTHTTSFTVSQDSFRWNMTNGYRFVGEAALFVQ